VKITCNHSSISRFNRISANGLLILTLVISFFVFSSTSKEKETIEQTPKEQLDTLIAQHQGKVIYVDFWASWCGPCRQSFPWMNKIEGQFKSQGFTIISINLDAEHDLAEKFLNDNPANFTVVYDPKGELARLFNIQGMPSSLIISKKGEVKYAHSGFFKQKVQKYEQEIIQLLAL